MSIRKRLIISNIAMIVIPVAAFLLIEMILGVLILRYWDSDYLELFLRARFAAFLLILIITNGLLTYFVSKSIIKPVKQLAEAARKVSEGKLDFHIEPLNNDELGQLAATFDQMRLKLKESAEIKNKYEENRKELIANISHDLKTPITSIKGYVEGIRDGVANTPEKMDRYLQIIYTKAKDMDHLIDELFLYSKLDLSRVPFHFSNVNLYHYFMDLIEELRFDFEKEGVSIAFHAEDGHPYNGVADREQLKRAVSNIMQNSLKSMDKEEKRIDVYMKELNDKILIQIRDNGKGISVEALPFIFDHFYRADVSRNMEAGGTGLGLAIVKMIVEEHGGEVWAESRLGEGTSIFLTLKKQVQK